MIKILQNIHPAFVIVLATIFEVSGDAIIRMSIYNHTGIARIGLMMIGALLLFGYGFFLNATPVAFGQIVGLYIVSLFIVWQIGNYIAFNSLPTLPIVIGGALVVTGGLIITFWNTKK